MPASLKKDTRVSSTEDGKGGLDLDDLARFVDAARAAGSAGGMRIRVRSRRRFALRGRRHTLRKIWAEHQETPQDTTVGVANLFVTADSGNGTPAPS